MMKRVIFIGWLNLTIMTVQAQDKVDIFGYFESQIMLADIRNQIVQLQSNKIRVDLESRANHFVKFGANFNGVTYHGKTEWPVLDLLPDRVTDQMPAEYRSYFIIPFEDEYKLDNAYVRLKIGRSDITLGKHPISLGSGYVWNPLDLFNTKDLFDPTYEQPGHNAARLDFQISDRTGMTMLYAPDSYWKYATKMALLKTGLSHFDVTLIGMERSWQFTDYINPLSILQPQPEQRRMIGTSLSGQLFGLGVWAETAINRMERSGDFNEWIIGTDYTLDNGTHLMAEFFRSSLGKSDAEAYTLNDWMRYAAAEQKALCREQLFGMIRIPATDLMEISFSVFASISDGSLALLPAVNYSLYENVELLAYLNLFLGEEATSYSKDLGNGGLVRARVYF